MNILRRLNSLYHVTSDISKAADPINSAAISAASGTGYELISGVDADFHRWKNTSGNQGASNQSGSITIGTNAECSFYKTSKFIKGTPGTAAAVGALIVGGGGGAGGMPVGHSSGGGGAGRLVLYDDNLTTSGTNSISVGYGGQRTTAQAGTGHPGGTSSIQGTVSVTAPGGGGGGTSSGQPAGNYHGRPGGSGGGGGCGHQNNNAGGASGGQAPGATFNEGSPGAPGCGAGGGPNRDLTPYGYTATNLNMPELAPRSGRFCAGGGSPNSGGAINGSGNGTYGSSDGGHGIVVIKVGKTSTFDDKSYNG